MTSTNELLEQARGARSHAYAPYSRFQVGAAVRTCDGRVFTGCNVENASYGLTTCAERTALCAAIAAGCKPGEFTHIAIVGNTDGPISPCGSCRQLMHELGGSELEVILGNLHEDTLHTTAGALLPGAFRLVPDTVA